MLLQALSMDGWVLQQHITCIQQEIGYGCELGGAAYLNLIEVHSIFSG